MLDWIELHYKVITGIAVPIIIAIIGIFKLRKMLKNQAKGNNNIQIIAEKDVHNNNSFNTTTQTGPAGIQVLGNNNLVNNIDLHAVKSMAAAFNLTMFPHTERAFNKIGSNTQAFLAILNSDFEKLSKEELEKFSEADVQMALISAIQGAGKTDSKDIHEILGRLINDRVQKPKHSIAELAINESIAVVAKLDSNLIKILAFSFLFSRTKYTRLPSESFLISKLSSIAKYFDDIDVTISKFEYLESISCGKVLQFMSNNFIAILSKAYPHLFLKKITSDQLSTFALALNVQEAFFRKADLNTYEFNPITALYLFEDLPVLVNDVPFSINDELKEKLKGICSTNRLADNEIRDLLLQNNPEFIKIIKLWDENNFSQFSLTAIGIGIGRAYLEQSNIGNYDINIWIN